MKKSKLEITTLTAADTDTIVKKSFQTDPKRAAKTRDVPVPKN